MGSLQYGTALQNCDKLIERFKEDLVPKDFGTIPIYACYIKSEKRVCVITKDFESTWYKYKIISTSVDRINTKDSLTFGNSYDFNAKESIESLIEKMEENFSAPTHNFNSDLDFFEWAAKSIREGTDSYGK